MKPEALRISLPHIELAAQVYGPADGLPVLALHGWLDNAMSFSRLAGHLPELRLVCLDLPGHGLSGHNPGQAQYSLWSYLDDILLALEQLGWWRCSLLGHSLGGVLSTLLAAALPERIERLALIDGWLPATCAPERAPAQLAEALRARLALRSKRKPLYDSREQAIQVRSRSGYPVSLEAAARLAERGLVDVEGGFTWSSDARLTLPSPLRMNPEQAQAFAGAVQCPQALVIATEGPLQAMPGLHGLLNRYRMQHWTLPGGHHLHLDSEQGARQVADCFKAFLSGA